MNKLLYAGKADFLGLVEKGLGYLRCLREEEKYFGLELDVDNYFGDRRCLDALARFVRGYNTYFSNSGAIVGNGFSREDGAKRTGLRWMRRYLDSLLPSQGLGAN